MVDLTKKKRVLVEYKSESKDKFINIEDMNEVHLVNAIRKIVTCEKGGEFRVTNDNTRNNVYVSNTIVSKEILTGNPSKSERACPGWRLGGRLIM